MLASVIRAADEAAPSPLFPAPYDIIWSAVCFAIVLFFFWKYALPKLNTMLDERSSLIEGQIEAATVAKAEADAALEEYRAQLADARGEASKIREQARLDGTKILAELKEQATAEAARITAAAQATIEAERQAAIVSLRNEVGALAISLASDVIGESLKDDKKAASLVDRFLVDLEADEKAKAAR
ncbi:MAG TPA: F0F1 ATP synthase subunit B [Terrimesophilobacter sp.]|nr:F0F1 ATP synthase subunit B [Terrimesophilobacter sp.]HRP99989.1 F0F1 ATP synthase subunit B [Terrimesophilobacter sp.]